MIVLDTNVLVRFIVEDNADQAKAATDLMHSLSEGEPGFICREVLVELVWVLEGTYKLQRDRIVEVIEELLSNPKLVVEEDDRVRNALAQYAKGGGIDFSDWMLLAAAREAGCDTLFTFEKKLARHPDASLLS